jgi:transketolase
MTDLKPHGALTPDMLCINTLRCLAIDAIETAKSGHPGLPLGAAPMAQVLWQRHLKVAATSPNWPNRDRFVLSAGHGSMLQYALLHLYGFDVSISDLKAFRQLGSITPGHPEFGMTPGVEATTGPLGQGAGNTVGMAIAERAMAYRFNRKDYPLVDHHTYALVSDGDLMEGLAHEAASLAGHLALGKLIWLYDANQVTLDGPAALSFTEDVAARFVSYGWQVLTVADGDHDLTALDNAMQAAKGCTRKPSLIIVTTTIGYGAPTKQGTSKSHGAPLGPQEAEATRAALGFADEPPFTVPQAAKAHAHQAISLGQSALTAWHALSKKYAAAFPEAWGQFQMAMTGALPENWSAPLDALPLGNAMSTREAGGRALNALAAPLGNLIGGDGDLSVSTLTSVDGGGDFNGQDGTGANIRFGVREHAMAAAANGIMYHGGLRPYTATFFVFSDYMRPSLRMAALSRLRILWVFTHDSLGVGEDGSTHQPVEHLAALRAMPHVAVLRPADITETFACYRYAISAHWHGPVAMVLGRQKLPSLAHFNIPQTSVTRGAYMLIRPKGAIEGLFIATGSEVHIAVAAAEQLAARGRRIAVVSMPSWELFRAQDAAYQERVLPQSVRARVSLEAGSVLGWHQWVGEQGTVLGLDTFGASGPGPAVMSHFGLDVPHACAAMEKLLSS